MFYEIFTYSNTKYTFENENINSLNFTLYIEKVYVTKMPYDKLTSSK